MSESREITVNVRNLAFGGDGVGEVVAQANGGEELLGITAFVPFTAVGEIVSARVIQQKPRYLKGELVSVQTSAAERVQPRCKYFTACGGCSLQHISYAGQLRAKLEMVRGALKAAKLPSAVLETLHPVVPGLPYGYRRRVSLHIDRSGRIGFYREQSRAVVAIDSCPISGAAINAALAEIAELGIKLQGKISSLHLEEDAEGLVAVLKSPYALSQSQRQEILSAARGHFQNAVLIAGGEPAGGFGREILKLPLTESGKFFLRVPAGSFTQVNWGINLRLIERVVQLAALRYGTALYDLYAGAGNFALPLARGGATVTAVECDKRLASFGRENAKLHHLDKRVRYVESSVEQFLKDQAGRHTADTIVADPPRSGLGSLVGELGFARKLLLISCHLPSFVRDVRALTERGWHVEHIEPFDMFAQTSYLEVLGVLVKQ